MLLQQKIQDYFLPPLDLMYSNVTRELTWVIPSSKLLNVCFELKNHSNFQFNQLIDLCGVDYSEYGLTDGDRAVPGVESDIDSRHHFKQNGMPTFPARFAIVYHFLSLTLNWRLRLKVFVDTEDLTVPSIVPIWTNANWYEREAFDLFGIRFSGHPDLRRILTDYDFEGHPFRKDFPLIGTQEVRYDPETERVIYEPVQIEDRTLVPKVIPRDNRYG